MSQPSPMCSIRGCGRVATVYSDMSRWAYCEAHRPNRRFTDQHRRWPPRIRSSSFMYRMLIPRAD